MTWTDKQGRPVKPDPLYGWKAPGSGPWVSRSSDRELAEAERKPAKAILITGRKMMAGMTPGEVLACFQRDNNRLKAEIARLHEALSWCVENDGECLGDHPTRLTACRQALESKP